MQMIRHFGNRWISMWCLIFLSSLASNTASASLRSKCPQISPKDTSYWEETTRLTKLKKITSTDLVAVTEIIVRQPSLGSTKNPFVKLCLAESVARLAPAQALVGFGKKVFAALDRAMNQALEAEPALRTTLIKDYLTIVAPLLKAERMVSLPKGSVSRNGFFATYLTDLANIASELTTACQFERALAKATECVDAGRTLNDAHSYDCAMAAGEAQRMMGRLSDSIVSYTLASQLAKDLDLDGEANIWRFALSQMELSTAQFWSGDITSGTKTVAKLAETQATDPNLLLRIQNRQVDLKMRQGDNQGAQALFQKSKELIESTGVRKAAAMPWNWFLEAKLLARMGDVAKAKALFEMAAKEFKKDSAKVFMDDFWNNNVGLEIAFRSNDVELARRITDESKTLIGFCRPNGFLNAWARIWLEGLNYKLSKSAKNRETLEKTLKELTRGIARSAFDIKPIVSLLDEAKPN